MQPTYIYVQHFMLTDDFGLFKKQDLGARLPTNYLNPTKIEVINNSVGSQIVAQTQIEQDMGPINPVQ